jgi:thermitase
MAVRDAPSRPGDRRQEMCLHAPRPDAPTVAATGVRRHACAMALPRPAVVVLAVAAALAAPAAGAAAAELHSQRLVVRFDEGVSSSEARKAVERHGGRVARRVGAIAGAVVRARGDLASNVLLRRLRDDARVRYAERDFLVAASAQPDDPLYAAQYGLEQPSSADVAAPLAWDQQTTCSKLAVLDSGIDKDHPDLKPNVWVNDGEKKGNDKDDDDNGYVDDYYGADIIDGKGSAIDENGHGTHVAGIIGAAGNNAIGVSGLCWRTTIIAVKFLDARGRGGTADAVSAIQYAVRRGAKIVNCSFGSSSKSEALHDAVRYAKDKGALLVVAAGNDGDDLERKPAYPASFTDGNILTVAASTATDGLAGFSNYGATSVDLAAPGDAILSTLPGGGYGIKDGTSMAAPLVAAAAALLRKVDSELSFSELKAALRDRVDRGPAFSGRVVSGGRLNVRLALDAAAR